MLNKWTPFYWVFRNMPGIIQNNLIHAMKFDQTLVCTCISWWLLKMQIVFRLVTGSEILHFYQAVSWWLSDRYHTYSSKDQILILTHCIDAFPSLLFFFFFLEKETESSEYSETYSSHTANEQGFNNTKNKLSCLWVINPEKYISRYVHLDCCR